jgi:branched-chain amino acid transport system substrate-binding protein
MANRKIWFGIIILVILLLAITFVELKSFTGRTINLEKKIIKVGLIIPLTGTSADAGEFIRRGSTIAVEELNPRSKSKYELIFEDSAYDPKKAISSYNKLINEDKISFVITYASSIAAALMPLANENKVIMIDSGSQSDFISRRGDYVFRTQTSVKDEAEFFSPIIRSIVGNELLNILTINTEYGQSVIEDYSSELKLNKVNIGLIEKFDSKETDFRTFLTKINSNNPVYVLIGGNGKFSGLLIKQAKELGIDLRLFGTSTSIERGEFIDITSNLNPSVIYPYQYDSESSIQLIKDYRKKYFNKYGKENELISALAYDSIKMIDYCVEKNSDKSQIRGCLDDLKDFKGASGTYNLDSEGNVKKQFILKTVKNGKFERLI